MKTKKYYLYLRGSGEGGGDEEALAAPGTGDEDQVENPQTVAPQDGDEGGGRRRALVFAQHVFGNFDYLDRDLRPYRKTAKLTPDYPREPETVAAWLDGLGLTHARRSAIRCFYDYMKPHDRTRHSDDELVARELALSGCADYLAVARYIHELRCKTDHKIGEKHAMHLPGNAFLTKVGDVL